MPGPIPRDSDSAGLGWCPGIEIFNVYLGLRNTELDKAELTSYHLGISGA